MADEAKQSRKGHEGEGESSSVGDDSVAKARKLAEGEGFPTPSDVESETGEKVEAAFVTYVTNEGLQIVGPGKEGHPPNLVLVGYLLESMPASQLYTVMGALMESVDPVALTHGLVEEGKIDKNEAIEMLGEARKVRESQARLNEDRGADEDPPRESPEALY